VLDVLDGDSIMELHGDIEEPVRLNGIDCPEKTQAYGNKPGISLSPGWSGCHGD
jgi:endonuclease YncB( thermonuclease family)